MTKKGIIILVAIVSIILCACSSLSGRDINERSESQYATESREFCDAENNMEIATEQHSNNVEDSDSKENVTKPYSVEEELIRFENTNTYEYDPANNIITINGIPYDIATNELEYYGDYMFYYMGNSAMENIMNAINNNLSEKYWRENFSDELLEKAKESTLLETFVDNGGKILNYYILNSQEFLHSSDDTEMPIVVEYSIHGETYNTILVFCMSAFTENEEVMYRTTDIFQLDNLDAGEK